MSPRSASHRPKHAYDGLKDISLPLESISDPCLPCSALHSSYCLSHDFTWLEKFALEKQTSQLSLVMPLYIGSVCMHVAISWANKLELEIC